MDKSHSDLNIEDLLKEINIVQAPSFDLMEDLKGLFERRLNELRISKTSACEILKIQSRTLNGILDGTQKSIDFLNLVKLSSFLQVPKERVVNLYIESLERNFSEGRTEAISPEEIKFIKENFDLYALKKSGFIDNLADFEYIKNKIVWYFGLSSIFDYKRPPADVAFSEGKVKRKNDLSRSFWIKSANDIFEAIDNQYQYDREGLIKFFPEIRWHSVNVELGLRTVVKHLFERGVTVIYLPSLSSLHLRGATFAVNNKPCIVLTDYAGFYPTLWFALIHELFHVLFDWDEIKANQYHLSDEDTEQISVKEKEEEANKFAREYLFSKEKTLKIKPLIHNSKYIEEFAKYNHVHPSFIYVFYAYDAGDKESMAWARARKFSPDITKSINFMNNSWEKPLSINDLVKSIRGKIYK